MPSSTNSQSKPNQSSNSKAIKKPNKSSKQHEFVNIMFFDNQITSECVENQQGKAGNLFHWKVQQNSHVSSSLNRIHQHVGVVAPIQNQSVTSITSTSSSISSTSSNSNYGGYDDRTRMHVLQPHSNSLEKINSASASDSDRIGPIQTALSPGSSNYGISHINMNDNGSGVNSSIGVQSHRLLETNHNNIEDYTSKLSKTPNELDSSSKNPTTTNTSECHLIEKQLACETIEEKPKNNQDYSISQTVSNINTLTLKDSQIIEKRKVRSSISIRELLND